MPLLSILGPAPSTAPAPLGRITIWGVEIYKEPTRKSRLLRTAKRDDLINLYEQVWAEPVMPHNEVWFKTDGGYCYSSFVQPVFSQLNKPEPEAAAQKFWGEVSVPFTDAFVEPDEKSKLVMRLYYQSTYRVVAAVQGKDGAWWYRLQEGIAFGPGPYVPAQHIRRFAPDALSPLGQKAKTKRIDIDLTLQSLTCYEDGKPMLDLAHCQWRGHIVYAKGHPQHHLQNSSRTHERRRGRRFLRFGRRAVSVLFHTKGRGHSWGRTGTTIMVANAATAV